MNEFSHIVRCSMSDLPVDGCHHCVSGEPNLGYYGTTKHDVIDDPA